MVTKIEKNNAATVGMFSGLIIGMLPLFFIITVYHISPESEMFYSLYKITEKTSVITSPLAPQLSSIMSFYCKFSPLISFLTFLLICKKLNVIVRIDKNTALKSIAGLFLLNIVAIKFLLMNSCEISTGMKLLNLFNENVIILAFMYSLMFFSCYILTFYFISFSYLCYLTWLESKSL